MTDKRAVKALAEAKAVQLWAAFDDNQKAGVSFGMFPAGPMEAAMDEGHDSRMLSVALMDIASKNGGMRA